MGWDGMGVASDWDDIRMELGLDGDRMGWDGIGWDEMGWDGMGWDGMG